VQHGGPDWRWSHRSACSYYLAIGTTRRPFQLFSWTSSAIGAIELGLTLIGTYGVLSDLVVQRSREIGVRVALGASAAAVVGLVVRQSLRYAAIGVVRSSGRRSRDARLTKRPPRCSLYPWRFESLVGQLYRLTPIPRRVDADRDRWR